jgi:large subunit ribosomal protein L31
MKKGIHPEYKAAKISCVCGNVIETRSTAGDFDVQICSSCHPFFTGKQKFVDTAGRVERFKRRYGNVGLKKEAAEASDAPAAEPEANAEAPAENPTT